MFYLVCCYCCWPTGCIILTCPILTTVIQCSCFLPYPWFKHLTVRDFDNFRTLGYLSCFCCFVSKCEKTHLVTTWLNLHMGKQIDFKLVDLSCERNIRLILIVIKGFITHYQHPFINSANNILLSWLPLFP